MALAHWGGCHIDGGRPCRWNVSDRAENEVGVIRRTATGRVFYDKSSKAPPSVLKYGGAASMSMFGGLSEMTKIFSSKPRP